MATEAQLLAALYRADKAGDHAGATRIAQIIQAQREPAGPAPVTLGGTAKAFGSGALGGLVSTGNAFRPGGNPDTMSLLKQGGR